jgi:prefoldin alpha subunit
VVSGEDLQASVQEDLARLEAYRDQLAALVRQQELVRMSLESHARAQQTLEELEGFELDREMLIPIGGETFLKAAPRSKEKVLLGIGSGIVAELDRARALEVLKERRSQLEKSEQSLLGQVRRLEQEAANVQVRVQAMYQQAQALAEAERKGTAPVAAPRGRPASAARHP